MARRIAKLAFLCLATGGSLVLAAEIDAQRPSHPPMIFEATAGPLPDLPSTRPATRPSGTAIRIPDAPQPRAQIRSAPIVFNERRQPLTIDRQPFDHPALFAEADPPRPGQPPLNAAPRFSAATVYEPWMPLSTLVRLRSESPVRAHEPILDPMGGSDLGLLGIFRTTPLAPQASVISDPFENAETVQLLDPPADDDPPATASFSPPLPALVLDKVTVPPATQPATTPATQPSR